MYNQIMRGPENLSRHADNDFRGLVMGGIFLAIVLLGMWLVYRMFMGSRLARTTEDPLEVAKLRFAKGEITKTELADIRKEIKA